jgi:hypothetical protein
MLDRLLHRETAWAEIPTLAAMIRGWLAASGNPTRQQAQQEMEHTVLPWIEQALAAGQSVPAGRTDLPSGLLTAVVVGMGQAMDTWMLTQRLEEEALPHRISVLIERIRGALEA